MLMTDDVRSKVTAWQHVYFIVPLIFYPALQTLSTQSCVVSPVFYTLPNMLRVALLIVPVASSTLVRVIKLSLLLLTGDALQTPQTIFRLPAGSDLSPDASSTWLCCGFLSRQLALPLAFLIRTRQNRPEFHRLTHLHAAFSPTFKN